MICRPAGLVWPPAGSLPGPRKILVAVGTLDEDQTASYGLDHE
jgi:hypothetical protein